MSRYGWKSQFPCQLSVYQKELTVVHWTKSRPVRYQEGAALFQEFRVDLKVLEHSNSKFDG